MQSGTVAKFQFNPPMLPLLSSRPLKVAGIPLEYVTPEISYQPHLSNPSPASDFASTHTFVHNQAPKKRKFFCEQDDMMTDDEELGCKISRYSKCEQMQWT